MNLKKQISVPKLPLVVVVGETASGKSSLGMKIAKSFDGEIIAADSWTVRRKLDIGTAKPSEEERREIPHHLIDIVEPDAEYSAAVFKKDALNAIEDIKTRNKLPVMVGGTGLYIDSVLFDYSFMKAGNRAERARLNALAISELLEIIANEGLDKTGVDIRNKRRLIRLIETRGAVPTSSQKMRSDVLVIGIKLNRARLRENIEKRAEIMFRKGLKLEVKELADEYGWEAEGLKGIGYREFRGYFKGGQSLAETKRKIIKSTLNLAKRQRTWFKRNRDILWFDDANEAFAFIKDQLNHRSLAQF